MFEQSILAEHPTNKTVSFAVSLSVQTLIVAVAILIPLIFTNQLQLVQLNTPLTMTLTPPPAPRPVVAVAQRATSTAPAISQRIFPIPTSIRPITVDGPAVIDPPTGVVGSVPGGIPTGIGSINNLLSHPPPPPPRVEAEKPQIPNKPIRVSSGVQEAMLLRRVVPVYPVLARQARISGTVQLMSVIAKDGTVQKLQVVSGHPLLVQAALDAVRQWVYRPTLLSGQPVEVICPIAVTFTLNQQ